MDIYKSNAAQSSFLGLCMCVLVTVYGDTAPSACILVFWLTQDLLRTSYRKEQCRRAINF